MFNIMMKSIIDNSKRIADLGDGLFQILSKSDPNKSYIIDIKDINAHKAECMGFRFNLECNHIKALKMAGILND